MRNKIFYPICLSLVIIFGVFKVLIFPVNAPKYFESKVGVNMLWYGQIVDEPERRENNQKLTLEISENNENLKKVKVQVTTEIGAKYQYGDWVKFYGNLEKPKNFTTDTGKEFDYINYLKKDYIFYLVSYPDIASLGGWREEENSSFRRVLFSLKNNFLEKINYAIPEPESLLMGGLILGEKASFDKSLRQEFVDTGTIHIVALSGYNVTIVAEWIMKLFSFLPQVFAIWLGIFAILLFIIMAGASSTAIRAGIMATLALIARSTGRTYDIGRALVLAATLMVMLNPMILLYDLSFQLSFLATVAVIYLSPKIEKYFTWLTKRFGLRDVFSVTVAAYIFVLPFILYKMGNLSLVALPANFLILPFIPFTMLLGFLTGFVGMVSYFLSVPVGCIAYGLLHYELGAIHFFAGLPFASLNIRNFPLIITLLIYFYIGHKLFGKSIRKLFSE